MLNAMPRKSKSTPRGRRPIGRKATGFLGLRIPKETLEEVKEWGEQEDIIGTSNIIREMIEIVLRRGLHRD